MIIEWIRLKNLILENIDANKNENEKILNAIILVDDRLNQVEKRLSDIIQKIEVLNEEISLLKENETKFHKESIDDMSKVIEQIRANLEVRITNRVRENKEELTLNTQELNKRLDLVDSSVKMLLLNSVMDKIPEE